MPHRLAISVLSVTCIILSAVLQAAALPIPKPPAIGAKAFILQDFTSGRVIAADHWARTDLNEGDQLELLGFVAGG